MRLSVTEKELVIKFSSTKVFLANISVIKIKRIHLILLVEKHRQKQVHKCSFRSVTHSLSDRRQKNCMQKNRRRSLAENTVFPENAHTNPPLRRCCYFLQTNKRQGQSDLSIIRAASAHTDKCDEHNSHSKGNQSFHSLYPIKLI